MSDDDKRSLIKDCAFINCGKGIGLHGADGFRIEGNTFSDIAGADIEIVNSHNIELVDNQFSDGKKSERSPQRPTEGTSPPTLRSRRAMVGWTRNFRLPWTNER